MQEIIDRANVGRATFYAHFENKDELFAREVKTATVEGAQDPSAAELARRERLKREG